MAGIDALMQEEALAKLALAVGHGMLLLEGHRWRRGEKFRRRMLAIAAVALCLGNGYLAWAYFGRPDLVEPAKAQIGRAVEHAGRFRHVMIEKVFGRTVDAPPARSSACEPVSTSSLCRRM